MVVGLSLVAKRRGNCVSATGQVNWPSGGVWSLQTSSTQQLVVARRTRELCVRCGGIYGSLSYSSLVASTLNFLSSLSLLFTVFAVCDPNEFIYIYIECERKCVSCFRHFAFNIRYVLLLLLLCFCKQNVNYYI